MITITRSAKKLSDVISKKAVEPPEKMIWIDGVVGQTEYELPIGWEPIFVTVSGLTVRDGDDEAYTFPFDGFRYTLIFDVAPGEVSIGAYSKRVV